jgi:hypothetical protein
MCEWHNIDQSASDRNTKLEDQEKRCGALLKWEWHAGTSTSYPYAYSNLQLVITARCLGRAIILAGSSKTKCIDPGVSGKKGNDARFVRRRI